MKPEELRIGNLVTIDKLMQESLYDCSAVIIKETYMPVVGIIDDACNLLIDDEEFDFDYNDILPIPLTEEWLINFGMELDINTGLSKTFYLPEPSDFGYTIRINKEDGNVSFARIDQKRFKHIKHVHQLQNLYFALTGEELTIKELVK